MKRVSLPNLGTFEKMRISQIHLSYTKEFKSFNKTNKVLESYNITNQLKKK